MGAVVVAAVAAEDRFGLGWRGPLAAGILSSLEQLDCLEIIAEQYAHLPLQQQRALQYLSKHIPITLHGVSLGLAGSTPPPPWRIENLARLSDELKAETVSEHLAFVRAVAVKTDGTSNPHNSASIEIGHLAAPPRNGASIEQACEHIRAVQSLCARPLLVENIPSLITPLGSDLTESQWLGQILQQSGAPFLLDLENLYANAVNRGENPIDHLLKLPLAQVHTVHLSGGTWVDIPWQATTQRRFLDDHRNDILPEVFELLTRVAAQAPQNLTVIIERDGNYPAMDKLLAQLAQAKLAVARGRQNAPTLIQRHASPLTTRSISTQSDNKRIEYLLAEIFCNAKQRQLFVQNPYEFLQSLNLKHLEEDITNMDWAGLLLMARSVAAKNPTALAGRARSAEITEHAF